MNIERTQYLAGQGDPVAQRLLSLEMARRGGHSSVWRHIMDGGDVTLMFVRNRRNEASLLLRSGGLDVQPPRGNPTIHRDVARRGFYSYHLTVGSRCQSEHLTGEMEARWSVEMVGCSWVMRRSSYLSTGLRFIADNAADLRNQEMRLAAKLRYNANDSNAEREFIRQRHERSVTESRVRAARYTDALLCILLGPHPGDHAWLVRRLMAPVRPDRALQP